jgi:hypothetical protein
MAKIKNDNLKLGIKGATGHTAFAKKKTAKKVAPKKKQKASLDVEKVSEMAEKLHVELSDDDIAKFTNDDDA